MNETEAEDGTIFRRQFASALRQTLNGTRFWRQDLCQALWN